MSARPARRRAQRDASKAIGRSQLAGDVCLECRMPLAHLDQTFGGTRRDGRFTLACEDCADGLVSISSMGLFMSVPNAAGEAVTRVNGVAVRSVVARDAPWCVSDREWFEANPRRSHRLRSGIPGEWEGMLGVEAGDRTFTMVGRLENGRVRWPLSSQDVAEAVGALVSPSEAADEAIGVLLRARHPDLGRILPGAS